VTDDKNEKIAVQIDLQKYGELWEEFYDSLISELRKDEEKIPLEDVIRDLKSKGKLTEDEALEASIDRGLEESKRGETRPHEQVMKEIRSRYK